MLPSTLPDAPSANVELQRIIEAILFAAKRPLTCKQVQEVFPELEQPDLADIQAALDGLVEAYQPRGIALVKVASGYRFQVRSDLSRWEIGRAHV